MHLLQAQPGAIADGSEAVDLGQTPGDILFLSAADTELASLANANRELPTGAPSLRLANLMQLSHNLSVDIYVEEMVAEAKLVVVRLLGGLGYWPYGVEQIAACCKAKGIPCAFLPGDDQPDAELALHSTLGAEESHRLWQYCIQGGPMNAWNFLGYAWSLLNPETAPDWIEPKPLLRAGLYWPGEGEPDLARVEAHWTPGAPVAAIVFYRALVQASNLAPVEGLIRALQAQGVNPLPIYCASLKESVSAATLEELLIAGGAGLVLNATGFAVSAPGGERKATPFDVVKGPVLQVIFSGGNHDQWLESTRGLSARDIAMNVALPEVDGRLLSRAVSFKAEGRFDEESQCSIVTYKAIPDRLSFVARLTAAWLKLAKKPAAERSVAIVLANYPNRDGRLGNGVGLDTPAGTWELLRAMVGAGYDIQDMPADGQDLIERLAAGPTNDLSDRQDRDAGEAYALSDYRAFFAELPEGLRDAIIERWGAPEADPFVEGENFILSAFTVGKVVIGLQPARGYNIDPTATYHDPDLVPPHGYLAFYAWLRRERQIDAIVHMGKHGNLEWLPGKAVALSESCYPEAVLGPLPHLYPFIVNDPGEGTQAKRRAQAVIIDHLTPPLTRAESYGPLADLERLVDEYYDAAGLDPRRLKVLKREILELTQRIGLDKDCGISGEDDEEEALGKLDNYLCELKELQIRDGLHIFGLSPEGGLLTDLLVALTRVPRGDGKGPGASLIRALASDLGLEGFDPLDCEMGQAWTGPRPDALNLEDIGPWRTAGDTLERLELLAQDLVAGAKAPEDSWSATQSVLEEISSNIRPAVEACGTGEIAGALRALDGHFLEPGPSGAPTRGRPEVLPTGRNFYSVDNRTVPTAAAWTLGWKSAAILIERYRQEEGAWPKSLALSAWGTSNMRTGGDDIAQALALLGVRPTWETASRRVTGYEVLPLSLLDRPRVDVTLRISGFFRDAFPAQIDLFDSAVRAVAALNEPEDQNPMAARVKREAKAFQAKGLSEKEATQRAGYRVFGSKPGAYGAGLQALIDEKGWRDEGDLARAYLAWGGYAYGAGAEGAAEQQLFEDRLGAVEAVIHNQDNREHDLLDSDDYYQFEGGMTAAVRHISGRQPRIYHNDHSRPESPRIRSLQEEVARVVRARVVNPKWIRGVMRHGYKGAFEMAATTDYLFAFAATARVVGDHHFDALYEAYLEDQEVLDFFEEKNPAALKEIAERLLEALERGLWKPRSNSAIEHLSSLARQSLEFAKA